jgi:plasmid stabilization system protein ParE
VTKAFRIHGLAEDELTSAASWYESKQAGLGESLLDLVDNIVDRICSGSLPSSPIPGVAAKGARRVLLRRFPYSIVFYERREEIMIVAFAHSSQRPGYWRSRKL